MDWILDHLQILLFVAAAIATLISKGRKSPDEAEDTALPPPAPVTGEDETVRRIREAILRKRAEREGQEEPSEGPPPLPEVPAATPVLREPSEPSYAPPPEPEEAFPAAGADEGILARQRELNEQLERLQAARRQVQAEVAAVAAGGPGPTSVPRRDWLHDLRSARNLRQAVVTAEIVGRPVSLR